MTDVIVTDPDVFEAHFLFIIMVHDVIEPCGCQGVTKAMMLWCCYLSGSCGYLTETIILDLCDNIPINMENNENTDMVALD